MINIVVILIIVGIIAGASLYIYKEKKKGTKCIGCPSSKCCSGSNCNCE